MAGKGSAALVAEKKHELSNWDCRVSTFHATHKDDVQKMVSSYMVYITDVVHCS
jgi:hypothetical protein